MKIFGYNIEVSNIKTRKERYKIAQQKRRKLVERKKLNKVECPVCHKEYVTLRGHFSAFTWSGGCSKNGLRKDDNALAHRKYEEEHFWEWIKLCEVNNKKI